MSPDEENNQDQSARRQMLKEIRRRAEEAELKRLEEEDKSRISSEASARSKKSSPAPFPVTAAESHGASNKASLEQKVLVLRERLQSALERGKTDKAAELLAELSKLIPDDPQLADFKMRLLTLQEERTKSRQKTRPPQSKPSPPVEDKAERDARRKKIGVMLEAGNSYYQQEKYDQALQYVGEVLNLDPGNEQAVALRSQVEKARMLEERIRLEEEERRAKDLASGVPRVQPVEESAPASGRPTDFWGSHISPKLDVEYELAPEEKGPVGPPPLPASQRFVKWVSNLEIPVKPIITIAVLIILGVVGWFVVDAIRNTVSPALYSVLVLPPSTAGDTSLTYVADGFAEDMMAELSRVSDVRVIAPATAHAFAASNATPGQIARAVGASYVLAWTMRRSLDRITIQLDFADTLTGRGVWSTRLQVAYRELPALRPEIIRGLLSGMEAKLNASDAGIMRRMATTNDSAYDAYLHGRGLLRHGDRFAPEEAIALFEEALRLDPDFGEAQAALAWAHMLAYETSPEMPPAHIAQAISCVQRALSAGVRNSETFRAWGLAEQSRGNYDAAIERFEQAVTTAPSDAEAQRLLAIAYAAKGKIELAVKAAQRSAADDPANIAAHTLLGQLQELKAIHNADSREDYKAALQAYEQGLRLARDKSDYGSGAYSDVLVYLQQSDRAMSIFVDRTARMRESYMDFYKMGRVQQTAGMPIQDWHASFVRARDILTALLALHPEDAEAQAYLALVYTRLGAFKDAITAIGHAQGAAGNDTQVLFLTARMYALQRDKSQALQYLGKALSQRYSLGSVLDMDFFNLHTEPEFAATLQR